MLGRLFGRKRSQPDPAAGPQLCMVALKSENGITEERVCKAWASLYPKRPPLKIDRSGEEPKSSEPGKPDVLTFMAGDRSLMVAVMPAPIPPREIEEACSYSWMWPEAREKMREQKVHALLVCPPDGNPLADALDVACLAGAVAAAGEGVGIYWGNAGQVHQPRMFVDMLKSSLDGAMYPVPLWVCVRVSGETDQGPFTLSTRGLEAFGHKEPEVLDTHMGLGELRTLAVDTIGYLLTSGPVLKSGQTFGRSATEKFKVEHTTSKFRAGEAVIRLHVP